MLFPLTLLLTNLSNGTMSDTLHAVLFVCLVLTGEQMRGVSRVVSFGCDLGSSLPNTVTVERWDDLPLVSDGYSVARDAIVARVTRLLDRLQEPQNRELEVS